MPPSDSTGINIIKQLGYATTIIGQSETWFGGGGDDDNDVEEEMEDDNHNANQDDNDDSDDHHDGPGRVLYRLSGECGRG